MYITHLGTKGLLWPEGEATTRPCPVAMSMIWCMSVWSRFKTALPGGLENIGKPLEYFRFCCNFSCFWSLQTSLLCIVEELTGGRSVALAVDVCNR